jgi:hypothetical protein
MVRSRHARLNAFLFTKDGRSKEGNLSADQ